MSVERYQNTVNGSEVEQSDLNLLADAGGLADDHVLAELLRLAPFSGGAVAKAILPSGTVATIAPAGASGSVTVNPFRAIVGTRDVAANIGALRNWNDIRSAIFVGPGGLSAQQALAANTSAQPRWDLLYAQLQVDAPGAQVSRYRKDPATEQVTVAQFARSLVQSIAVSVLPGTAGGPRPALPPDGGGTFFFPLANVRVPANFGPLSTVGPGDIEELLPYVPLAATTGASTLVPANQQYKEGGTVLSSPNYGWSSGAPRPALFMPPSMSGCEGRLVALDLYQPASSQWSHQPGSVVDDSRDWRNRIWRWFAAFNNGLLVSYPWAEDTFNIERVPYAGFPGASGGSAWGFGQSFHSDGQTICTPPLATPAPVVAQLAGQNAGLPANVYVALTVDPTSGALRMQTAGAPGLRCFFWLEATGPFPNF